ncbi:MAG: xanthine dehydrogenase small subunit [Rhizobiales bacterium]|nr:xanthine dehydrogenase small subunit [Hyphomicrobiales bacterium]
MTRSALRFLRRGAIVEISSLEPTLTVLDYLRLDEKSRGTKEGCNEGDCGACTVVLGSIRNGKIAYEPVNACILFLGQIDGKELVTVEDLAEGGKLHPIQQALVSEHASQCGFCTPGFVMSLFALYHGNRKSDRQQVVDQIAGNLCRCTGYRPIVDAALKACNGSPADRWTRNARETAERLGALDDGSDLFIGSEQRFFAAPASGEALSALTLKHPDAIFVAGSTDAGLWVTKQLRTLPKIIHLGRVRELRSIAETNATLSLGAAVTYSEAQPFLARLDPDLGEMLRRLGSKQVRASGTIAGNIANGSPIGDTPPALLALGARLELRHNGTSREIALEDFHVDYGKQDRAAGEVVWRVDIPKLRKNEHFRCFKISKRFDQDISAVMGAFKLTIEGAHVAAARIAFGGMAATPKRARQAEGRLIGARLDRPESWQPALDALGADYQPISDMRASAAYRGETARALLLKALHEIAGGSSQATRIVGMRGEAA